MANPSNQRRFYAAIAVVVPLCIVLSACSTDKANLTPAQWVQQGIANFRAATSVFVVPDADGEANCEEVVNPCVGFTLTQTTTNQPYPMCGSIPQCADVFFPIVKQYGFDRLQWSGSVAIDGSPDGCDGWCSWKMTIDRATGEILDVDVYLKGGTHIGWPVYSFENYIVHGQRLITPNPQPPKLTGTIDIAISGGQALHFSTSNGSCSVAVAGARFYAGGHYVPHPTAPRVWSFNLLFELTPNDQSELNLQISPGHEYLGRVSTNAINGDTWHRSLSGTISSDDPKYHDSVSVQGEINCG